MQVDSASLYQPSPISASLAHLQPLGTLDTTQHASKITRNLKCRSERTPRSLSSDPWPLLVKEIAPLVGGDVPGVLGLCGFFIGSKLISSNRCAK